MRALQFIACIIVGTVLFPALVPACQIPVFRYALEHWPAEPYEIVVFHSGPLAAGDRAVVDRLVDSRKSVANLSVTDADISQKLDKSLEKLWKQQAAKAGAGEPPKPWVVVRFPEGVAADPLWAGPLDAVPVGPLSDSPARRQVVKRLTTGQSAVWVLVDSGDKDRDDTAAKLLEVELASQQKAMALPEMNPDDPGPRLLSNLPLKLEFSLVRVSRADEKEKYFVGMLTHGLRAEEQKDPVVVPVFGQGRALCTLVGKEIEPKGIADVASFLVGACSCQVKELNPGFDLVTTADWLAVVENRAPEQPAGDTTAGAATTRPAVETRDPGDEAREPPGSTTRRGCPGGHDDPALRSRLRRGRQS